MSGKAWSKEETEAAKTSPWQKFKGSFPWRSYDAFRSKRKAMMKDGLIPIDKQWLAPRYTRFERMEGDVVVTGDWHIPFTDWKFAAEVIAAGEFLGIKQLLIAGDLFDFKALAHFISQDEELPTLQDEFNNAEDALSALMTQFNKIVIVKGNHEFRLLRMLKTKIKMQTFQRMFTKPGDHIIFSDYAYCLIDTEHGTYRATHPKNYSQVKNSVAQRMADVHSTQSIINFHGHFSDEAFAKDGTRACISCGCMLDPNKIDYKKIEDTTHPEWNVSFGAIINGTWMSRNKNPRLDHLGLMMKWK